jgi:peptide deformylase
MVFSPIPFFMRERRENGKGVVWRNPTAFDPARPTAYIAAMAVRNILVLPDQRLRLVSDPVKTMDAETRKLIEDMFETMHDAPGIGLAAIQVGVPKRVVTLDLAKKDEKPNPQVFINPELVWVSPDKGKYEEGCLSIPDYYEEVERPAQVKVKYFDIDLKPREVEASGLLATCLQHEIDHINGVLFIDHISKLKRDRVIKKFIKAAKQAGGVKPGHPHPGDKARSHVV